MRKTPGAALAGLLVIAAVVRADDAKKAADLRAKAAAHRTEAAKKSEALLKLLDEVGEVEAAIAKERADATDCEHQANAASSGKANAVLIASLKARAEELEQDAKSWTKLGHMKGAQAARDLAEAKRLKAVAAEFKSLADQLAKDGQGQAELAADAQARSKNFEAQAAKCEHRAAQLKAEAKSCDDEAKACTTEHDEIEAKIKKLEGGK